MSRIIRRLAVVSVLAAVVVPAAGATNFGPKDPWYEYGVALTNAQRHEQTARVAGVQPTSPWYAYDAALRKAQHQRHAQSVGISVITDTLGGNGGATVADQRQPQSVKSRVAGVQPTSPWYAYDAALRKAQHQRHAQSVGIRVITDTLGGNGKADTAQ